MTEWYVYLEGVRPMEVILGRRAAVNKLFNNARSTEDERRRASLFLEAPMCDLGSGLRVVGWFEGVEDGEGEEYRPDRSIIRVLGPGTEV